MKRRITFVILLISILSMGLLAGCASKNPDSVVASEGKTQDVKQVRIMCPSNYLPFVIANEKGFFQEAFGEDIEVVFSIADSGSIVMETMTAGEVEFAALGDMPVIQARVNGLDVKVISSFFTSTTGYQLIAAKDSGIQAIEDIKGKKVAVMSGSTNHKLFLKYLQSVGLTENDVEIVFLKNKDQLAAFVGNNVDAAVTQVPTSMKIIQETGAYEIVNAEGYDNILTVIAGDNQFMQKHPELAEAFLEAVNKSTAWIEDNKEEAFQIVADYMGDSYDNVELYYNTRTFTYRLDEDVKAGLTDTISYLYEQKTISKELDVNELIDDTYINHIGAK